MLTRYLSAGRCMDKELAGETGPDIRSNTHNDEVAREEISESCQGTHNSYQVEKDFLLSMFCFHFSVYL